MGTTREQKTKLIESIASELSASQAVFAIDYRGISVPQVNQLRAQLRENDAKFMITKNTLTDLAAKQAGVVSGFDEWLVGPTALTFIGEDGDIAAAAKAITQFQKEYELLEFKGGFMGEDILAVDEIVALSKLPSKAVLQARLTGLIASPITGVVRSLNGLISGLAVQLGQIAEQGLVGGSAAAEDEKSEAEEPAVASEPKEGEADTPVEAEEPADEQEAKSEETNGDAVEVTEQDAEVAADGSEESEASDSGAEETEKESKEESEESSKEETE